jgi:acetyl esterase/lipase
MKSKYIIISLVLLTVATFGFIFENVFSIWEQASYARFRPVTTGLPSAQIARDVKVGDVTADIFTVGQDVRGPATDTKSVQSPAVPKAEGQIKRPLLVIVHGGFFQGGNKKNYAYLGGIGVRSGYVVVVVQMPHYPGIFTRPFYSAAAREARALPAQAKMFTAFLKGVKTLGDQYGFDGERVHILAHGSGALLLGDADVTAYRSVILVSPIYSLTQNVIQIAPMQLRALDGYIQDADAIRLSPAEWMKRTKSPVLLLCTERDLPYIKDACKGAQLARMGAKPVERVVVQRPSHFELMFHLGSKVEDATEPFKKFLFDNAKL